MAPVTWLEPEKNPKTGVFHAFFFYHHISQSTTQDTICNLSFCKLAQIPQQRLQTRPPALCQIEKTHPVESPSFSNFGSAFSGCCLEGMYVIPNPPRAEVGSVRGIRPNGIFFFLVTCLFFCIRRVGRMRNRFPQHSHSGWRPARCLNC